jgi:hypothetical protein
MQRARIPVKEVSHELRVQNKSSAGGGQRSDCDIDIARRGMRNALARGDANVPPMKKRRAACVAERRSIVSSRSKRQPGCPADHGS